MRENKLNQLMEHLRSAQLAEQHLQHLSNRAEIERKRLLKLEKQLDKEYLDYVRLKRLSVRGLFQNILRDKQKQLEIEHQEYLHATLQYNECLKSLDLIEFEQKVLLEKVAGLEDLRKQVESLLLQRDSALSKQYPQLHRALITIDKSNEDLLLLKREIHDAAIVTAKAHQIITEMIQLIQEEINDDLNWGDFSNRGLLQKEFQERKRMDRVVDLSFSLKSHIKKLQMELDDIYRLKSIPRFNRFDDLDTLNEIFYDRLVSDWILSKELSSTFKYLRNADDSLKRIASTLDNLLKQSDHQIKYLEEKRRRLLEE